MSLISSSIPNFVNGVSQQPYMLRLSSQGELQENGLSTVSSGLRKRPPTEHLAKIGTTPLPDAFVHMIDRDGAEQYQVIVTNGDLKVYDLLGSPKTVNFTNKAYLNTALPASQSFALTTVADYSFVVNKSVKALASTTLVAARPYEALINVKSGFLGKDYSITINGTQVAYFQTNSGATASDIYSAKPNNIALNLYNALNVAPFNAAPWTLTRSESSIYISNSTTNFTITTEDNFGNQSMVAIKDNIQKFTDLPANPQINGFVTQITGDASSQFDNYWVKFVAGGGANKSTGVWKECAAPGISVGLNANTMPHLLIREADGTFTFKPATWSTRQAGDSASSPDPSFIGRTISDVCFFQNRLGFLSDENYITSETGKYFNVFRTTVTALLDSDPIDVTAATNKVAILSHAVGFNKQLLLFSNQQQFVIDGADLLSPKRVPIKPTTDFSVNTSAKPVAAGRNIYFTTDKGNWSAVREYFADLNNLSNDATDVTSHVPKYIPSNVVKIAAGPTEDILALLSANDRTRLYIYKYYFSGNDKLQSSWSSFNFSAGGTILNCDFIRSVLYLVISRADGLYFEKIDFSIGASVVGEPYQVLLDRKVQISTGGLSFAAGVTTISGASIGYTLPNGQHYAVSKGGGTIKPGQLLTVTVAGGIATIPGDVTASPLVVGLGYRFKYSLSILTFKTQALGGGVRSSNIGRTQLRNISFNHADTGYYKVLVTPQARQTYAYIFSGKYIGTPSAITGNVGISSGKFKAPVMSQNTTVDISIESELPLPLAIVSADWEALYVNRSRSM